MKVTRLSLFSLLSLFLVTSCGVKSPPVPPEGTSIPSVLDKYQPDEAQKNGEKEKTKENE